MANIYGLSPEEFMGQLIAKHSKHIVAAMKETGITISENPSLEEISYVVVENIKNPFFQHKLAEISQSKSGFSNFGLNLGADAFGFGAIADAFSGNSVKSAQATAQAAIEASNNAVKIAEINAKNKLSPLAIGGIIFGSLIGLAILIKIAMPKKG